MIKLISIVINFSLLFLSVTVFAQDRNIQINEVYPPDMFVENGGRIINVQRLVEAGIFTSNAVGDGINDDSDAIIAAMDWVMDQLKEWYANGGGVHWRKFYVIYFPNGIYKVTKPLVYSGERVIDPIFPTYTDREGTQKLMLVGQSRENTVIKLDDNHPNFQTGAFKPVVAFSKFDKETYFNNMPSGNQFRNFTIDAGQENPKAVGLDFFGANTARIDNIKIMGDGEIGLHVRIGSAHGYYSNIIIEGMNQGIRMEGDAESHLTIEYVTLRDQIESAVILIGISATLRKIFSSNSVEAISLRNNGVVLPHMVIIDSEFRDGDRGNSGINIEEGSLFSRNVNFHGYEISVEKNGRAQHKGNISEYISDPITIFNDTRVSDGDVKSMNLFIEEYPIVPWISDFSDWANVDNYPGSSDAERVQNAMDSGKKVIYFPQHSYDFSNTIVYIPASVKQIIGLQSFIQGYGNIFDIDSSSPDLLTFNGVHLANGQIVQNEHRNLFWESTQSGGNAYDSNLDEKGTKLHINNTHGFARYENKTDNIDTWVRYNNEEKGYDWQYTADEGCTMVMLGFKSEKTFSVFRVKQGAKMEVLGGLLNRWSTDADPDRVGIYNDNGDISVTMASNGPERDWSPMVEDNQDAEQGETKSWEMTDFPDRGWAGNIVIPLYASYSMVANPKDSVVSIIALSKDTITLFTGEKFNLEENIIPLYAKDKNITWSTENTNTATVDQEGVITAVSTGNTNIIITSNDGGASASCYVQVVPPTEIVVLDQPIIDRDDDVEEFLDDGELDFHSSDLQIGFDYGYEQLIGLRFIDLNIPHGANITNAYIQFTSDVEDSDPNTGTIKAHDADDAPPFTEIFNVTNRPLTSQFVEWIIDPWDDEGLSGEEQRSPDIKEIVQSIVNRSGWKAGNDMVFVISGTDVRTAVAYDQSSLDAPVLHVEFMLCQNAFTYYADNDEDGFGDEFNTIEACVQPAGYVLDNTDCDDNDNTVNPDAVDIPDNGVDDDCSGMEEITEDDDGDGIPNDQDQCPNDVNNDVDNDGLCSEEDNCPDNSNPDQADIDGDGIGDLCDEDIDGDGFINANDCAPNDGEIYPGGLCDDGDDCTVNDMIDENCGCQGEFVDTDSDGLCDTEDNCPDLLNLE